MWLLSTLLILLAWSVPTAYAPPIFFPLTPSSPPPSPAVPIQEPELLPTFFRPQLATLDPTCQVVCDWTTQLCSLDKQSCVCRYPSFPIFNGSSLLSCATPSDLVLDSVSGCVVSNTYTALRYCPLPNGVSLAAPNATLPLALTLCTFPFTGIQCTTSCWQSSDYQTCRAFPMSCELVNNWFIANQLCEAIDAESIVAVPNNSSYRQKSSASSINTQIVTDTVLACYFSQSVLTSRMITAAATTAFQANSIGVFCDIIANSSVTGSVANALYRSFTFLYYDVSDMAMANYNVVVFVVSNYMRCVDPTHYAVPQILIGGAAYASTACFPCRATCNYLTEVCSLSGGGCLCMDDSVFNATVGHCQKLACAQTDQYGFDCSNVCSANAPLGAVCDNGPTGSGNQSCPSPLVLNNAGTQCTTQHCAANVTDLSVCNRHGICGGAAGAFGVCYCDLSWDGPYCAFNNDTAVDACDCGTVIGAPQSLSPGTVLTDVTTVTDAPRISLLQLYTTAANGSVSPSSPTALRPIGSVTAATHLCWLDATCTSIITFRLQSGVLYNVPVFGNTPPLFVLFMTSSPGATMTLPPQYQSYSITSVNHYSGYNCPLSTTGMPAFDTTYYNNNHRAAIQDFLQSHFTPLVQATFSTAAAAALQFRYSGLQVRYNPNANCLLTPVLYSGATCQIPTCPVVGQICSSHGFCVSSTSAAFGNTSFAGTCQCNTFASTDTSALGLANVPAWSGLACQYTSLLCLNPGDTALCSGYSTACRPLAIWNPSISVFSINATDFVPQCDCTGLPSQGQYCQTSRCGDDGLTNSNGCNRVGACLLNSTSNSFSCVCPANRVGVHCEIDASACANSQLFPPLSCSNQGTCSLNTTTSLYACQCFQNFSGALCQNSQCPPSLMTPGHGTCVNGVFKGCYPVYTGSTCAVDQCSQYGGIVTNGSYSCDCSASHVVATGVVDAWDTGDGFNTTGELVPANLANISAWTPFFNGQLTASCWPACPSISNVMCNNVNATCRQAQAPDGTRTATCQCPNGWILNTTLGYCTSYCAHGVVPSGWSAQQPLPCLCPNSGFSSGSFAFPLCDHPLCTVGQGVYNNVTQSCKCFPPYTGVDCNELPASCVNVVPWLADDASSPFRCSCSGVSTYSDPTQPFDCWANTCAPNGVFLAQTQTCVCLGLWRTLATDMLPCLSTFCLNGGQPNVSDTSVCSCLYPFTSGPLGLCEDNVCINETTLFVDALDGCVCNQNYTGAFCEQSVLNPAMFFGETQASASADDSTSLSPAVISGIAIGAFFVLVAIMIAIELTLRVRLYEQSQSEALDSIHERIPLYPKSINIKKYT